MIQGQRYMGCLGFADSQGWETLACNTAVNYIC